MNISSIIVKTLPKHIDALIETLKSLDGVDYHFHDELGRIIVTIEAEDVSGEIRILGKIEKLEHVISAEMSYSYAEEELEKEIKALNAVKDHVPNVLRDDEIDADDIRYAGDVENYLEKKK